MHTWSFHRTPLVLVMIPKFKKAPKQTEGFWISFLRITVASFPGLWHRTHVAHAAGQGCVCGARTPAPEAGRLLGGQGRQAANSPPSFFFSLFALVLQGGALSSPKTQRQSFPSGPSLLLLLHLLLLGKHRWKGGLSL
jgi:hypothetical protein